jgi:UDP-GlcNAc:undecaprenyl-phosphate GlcNAc-1-phosphate transferase
MWTHAVAVIGTGTVCGLVVLLALLRLAPKLGLIDAPGGRKAHAAPTAVVGGLAVAIGATLALTLLSMVNSFVAHAMSGLSQYVGLLIGLAALLAIGIADDRANIPARYKMLVQAVFCSLAIWLDNVLVGNIGVTIGGVTVHLGGMLFPFTLLVMVTIINALNMIDGVDGLAGGIAFCALVIMAKAAFAGQYWTEAMLLCAVVGTLGAFLLINFPIWPGRKARAFLGDGGTLLLGFLLAYFAIRLSAIPHRVFRPSTVIWFFFIPVADCVLLYLRRLIKDGAPARPGRDHIHHVLLARYPPWATTWILVGVSALFSAGAYFAERTGAQPIQMIAGWIISFLLFAAITQKAWSQAWSLSHARTGPCTSTQVETSGSRD